MGNRLFVGNLPFTATEEMVRAAFEGQGTVEEVHLATDRSTGRSRGFAFVTVNSPDGIESVISKMDGAMLDGRPLRVNEAQDRPRPGFGGGHMPGARFDKPPKRKGSRRRNPRSRW